MSYNYEQYRGLIESQISKYTDTDVPASVLRSKAKQIFAETEAMYDPSKGEFGAILRQNLKGLNRFIGSSMQIRMPEHKQQKVRLVSDMINTEYGDDEDSVDYRRIGRILGMKPKTVESIYSQSRRKIISDPSVEETVAVPYHEYGADPTTEIYNKLVDPRQKDVFSYSLGINGKPEVKTNSGIAKAMGISESYVRKIKGDILGNIN